MLRVRWLWLGLVFSALGTPAAAGETGAPRIVSTPILTFDRAHPAYITAYLRLSHQVTRVPPHGHVAVTISVIRNGKLISSSPASVAGRPERFCWSAHLFNAVRHPKTGQRLRITLDIGRGAQRVRRVARGRFEPAHSPTGHARDDRALQELGCVGPAK